MKQTVNVNIASVAFTLDEDACRVLRNYFDEIKSRLPEDDNETLEDIEARVAELFSEKVTSPMRVITLDTVRSTMNQIGAPSEFGDRSKASTGESAESTPDEAPKKLFRSRTNRSIAGICGGLGEFFNADPTLLRLLMLLMILFGGLSIWAYIILWIVIPEAPVGKFNIKYGTNNKKQ